MIGDVAICIEVLQFMKDLVADLALPHAALRYYRNSFYLVNECKYLAHFNVRQCAVRFDLRTYVHDFYLILPIAASYGCNLLLGSDTCN